MEPWVEEPNRWEFREYDLPCLLLRSPAGAWAGYVGVPPGHPAYGLSHEDERLAEVSVYGGLRFSGPGEESSELAPGYWWFGWHCGHEGHARPRVDPSSGVYRDMRFARAGTEYLARQLAKMAGVKVDPAIHPERLRQARGWRGLGIEELAHLAEVPVEVVAACELGLEDGAPEHILRLALALDVSVGWLVGEEDNPVRRRGLPPDWEEILRTMPSTGKVTAEEVEAAIRYLRDLEQRGLLPGQRDR